MPAVTTILMVAGTAYQAVQAINQKAEADKGIAQAAMNAERVNQSGVNELASLKVPTLGTELAQQNIQARQQADIQGLKDIGAAGVLGGLTANNQQARAEDLQLAANADQMAYNRDMAVAQQAQANSDAKLNRSYQLEMSRLQGAQTASAANQSAISQAMGSGVQIAGDIATMDAYKGKDPKKLFGNKTALNRIGDDLKNSDAFVLNKFAPTINTVPGGLIG